MSMHVLICSYEFDLGAEGICTGRLTRALLEAGCQVTIVTSPEARTSFHHERLSYRVVSPAPLRPAKLFFRLAPLLGHIPTRYCYIWSRRIAGLRLEQLPDVVYGRAHPYQGVAAAHGLASRLRLPLWTHFSDPMPSPFWQQGHPEYKQTLRGVRRLLADSQVLTLTTPEALVFQEGLVGKLDGKAFVLNHISPDPKLLPPRQTHSGKVFGYFGRFYGHRNARALLEGFRLHLRSHPSDRMLLVGTEQESVGPEAARLGIESAMEVVPRVDDVRSVMAETDVLLATDSFSAPPIFMSTKLIEYLVVNRPVLLISPPQSPGAKLVSRFPETASLVTSEQTEAVSTGLAQSGARVVDDSIYRKRFVEMEPFSSRAVAERFLQEAAARKQSDRTR